MRYLTRIITPEDYDAAVRLRPETCPMHYMGDRRTGRQLLADFRADAAVSVAALAQHLAVAAAAGSESGSESGADAYRVGRAAPGGDADCEIARGGYMRACGGRGLLEGIAAAVGGLAGVLAAAGPGGVGCDEWARAVREVSAGLGCVGDSDRRTASDAATRDSERPTPSRCSAPRQAWLPRRVGATLRLYLLPMAASSADSSLLRASERIYQL